MRHDGGGGLLFWMLKRLGRCIDVACSEAPGVSVVTLGYIWIHNLEEQARLKKDEAVWRLKFEKGTD
jgi:hypothetical protein